MSIPQAILGWPVDEGVRAKLRAIHPLPIVVPDSVQTDCASCGARVWIGPRQASLLLAQPTLRVCCILCLVVPIALNEVDTLSLGNPDSKIEGK